MISGKRYSPVPPVKCTKSTPASAVMSRKTPGSAVGWTGLSGAPPPQPAQAVARRARSRRWARGGTSTVISASPYRAPLLLRRARAYTQSLFLGAANCRRTSQLCLGPHFIEEPHRDCSLAGKAFAMAVAPAGRVDHGRVLGSWAGAPSGCRAAGPTGRDRNGGLLDRDARGSGRAEPSRSGS